MKLLYNFYSESAPLVRDKVWLLGIAEHKGEYFCFIGSEMESVHLVINEFDSDSIVDIETQELTSYADVFKECFEKYRWTRRCNYIEGFQILNNVEHQADYFVKYFSIKGINEIVEELSKEL